MSRKHFTELAAALNSIRPTGHESCGIRSEAYDMWWAAVRTVADTCEASNPRFNRGRFIKACDEWRIKV